MAYDNMKTIFNRPYVWFFIYFAVIFVFAVIYMMLPQGEWSGAKLIEGFIDALYFSVVTITTLGFGDIYPAAGTEARILVSVEAVFGILSIGFFLNDIAIAQSKRLDDMNKCNEEEKNLRIARNRLLVYKNELHPVFERYLRGIYELTTPLENRKFPDDLFNEAFAFQFKDMRDLYGTSLLMTNEFGDPVVAVHFRNQRILYNELKEFVTNADLSYWPELEGAIFLFFRLHHEFQYENVIINYNKRTMGEGKTLGTIAVDMISKTEGEPQYMQSNIINAYVALYESLKANIAIVKNIVLLLDRATAL